jgi:hypothetical protein
VQNCLGTINLVPATGRIGKPKSGCGTIVGTANGQGGREHGQKCDQLPGWRDISNPEHRRHIASVWKIDERDLPGPGVDAYELIRLDLSFSQAADNALIAYARPGNVRELRNVVERAVLLWPARVIELAGDVTLEALEREHIQRVLARTATLIEAARILGIDTSTLYRKRKRYEQS